MPNQKAYTSKGKKNEDTTSTQNSKTQPNNKIPREQTCGQNKTIKQKRFIV